MNNNDKKYGVWMDTQHASVVKMASEEEEKHRVLAHITSEEVTPHANENNENNQKRMLLAKFFKEIASHLLNATHVHLTGTGQAQEQFIKYLADTPRFKQTVTEESTSVRMSDVDLLDYFAEKCK